MRVLGKFGVWRHVVVGATIGLTTLLAGVGVLGGGSLPERFDARTVVVAREGETALRITEFIDIDFGDADRRGYLRRVPNDFGEPADVTASSPDAAADVDVTRFAGYTEIRIGDPGQTFTGQHRYELGYTLPDAHYDAPEFAAEYGDGRHLVVDLVSPPGGVFPGDDETDRYEAIVTGWQLDPTICDVGDLGDEGGCTLTRRDDRTYRVEFEPLPADTGLTVGGTIVEFTDPVVVEPPPIPERRGGGPSRALIAFGFAVLGLVGAVPLYFWARNKGRNQVYAGGAADAAFGDLPAPGDSDAAPPIQFVDDADLADLATIEFVPPKGIDPWEAAVLLTERCDDATVQAWLSGLAGRDAISISQDAGNLVIASGPKRSELGADDAALLDSILSIDDPYVTGEYDKQFAAAWTTIHRKQTDRIDHSGWWVHQSPGAGLGFRTAGAPFGFLMMAAMGFMWFGSTVGSAVGLFRSWPLAVLIGLFVPAVVAYLAYRVMLPARSAHGSALALRTESFRRFLDASEGRHVEWAWEHGLLREYSGWAVALGEADAWSDALEKANVPAPAHLAAAPLFIPLYGSSMHRSRVQPQKSGSGGFGGGGGGFGGGGVGGGGGGGSSGSW